MNRITKSLIYIGVVATLFISCQKDEPDATTTLYITIESAYTPKDNQSKVYIDNAKYPRFEVNDEVWVNGTMVRIGGTAASPTLNPLSSDYYSAIFPHEIVSGISGGIKFSDVGCYATLNLPTEQEYDSVEVNGKYIQKINAPMAAYSSGSSDNLSFKNVCALLRVRVRNNLNMGAFKLNSITVSSSDCDLAGTGTLTYDSGTGEFSLVASGESSVTLTGLTENIAENKSSKDYYIYIPPVTGDGTQFTIKVNGVCQKQSMEYVIKYTTEDDNATIEKSSIGNISMLCSGDQCVIESIHPTYYFTVASGKQVYFSPGNLQYQASTNTWRFAEEQWIALTTSQYSGNRLSQEEAMITDKWSDLFGWGTSGHDNGNSYYFPYNRIYKNGYASQGYGYGPYNGSSYSLSLTDDYASSDWGVSNKIKNGGNSTGMWRTLTNSEWQYIFKTRANYASLYAKATVNGVAGCIILPDNWAGVPDGLTMTVGSSTLASTNVYTIEKWRRLEQLGAIFLPATGICTDNLTSTTASSNISTLDYLYYWSSTNSSTGAAYKLAIATATTGGPATNSTSTRNNRIAVRLVQDK